MTNFESVLKAMAEALNAEAPLGIAIITIVFFFSLVIRLYDFICHSASHEMRQIQKQLGECQETITELEKKHPPISPCDFHSSCKDCHLYNTFCWKIIAEKERNVNE